MQVWTLQRDAFNDSLTRRGFRTSEPVQNYEPFCECAPPLGWDTCNSVVFTYGSHTMRVCTLLQVHSLTWTFCPTGNRGYSAIVCYGIQRIPPVRRPRLHLQSTGVSSTSTVSPTITCSVARPSSTFPPAPPACSTGTHRIGGSLSTSSWTPTWARPASLFSTSRTCTTGSEGGSWLLVYPTVSCEPELFSSAFGSFLDPAPFGFLK